MNGSFQEIKNRWEEFLAAPFPGGEVEEVKGICLVELDAYASGAVGTFVGNGGNMDSHNLSILNDCARELQIVIGDLSGNARSYFERLQTLTMMVLREARARNV